MPKVVSVATINIAHTGAGWSSLVARRAHNPKVVSSNLAPATTFLVMGNKIRIARFGVHDLGRQFPLFKIRGSRNQFPSYRKQNKNNVVPSYGNQNNNSGS